MFHPSLLCTHSQLKYKYTAELEASNSFIGRYLHLYRSTPVLSGEYECRDNHVAPEQRNQLLAWQKLNKDFKTRYAIVGGEWHFSKSGYAFLQSRLGDSIDAQGKGIADAVAISILGFGV